MAIIEFEAFKSKVLEILQDENQKDAFRKTVGCAFYPDLTKRRSQSLPVSEYRNIVLASQITQLTGQSFATIETKLKNLQAGKVKRDLLFPICLYFLAKADLQYEQATYLIEETLFAGTPVKWLNEKYASVISVDVPEHRWMPAENRYVPLTEHQVQEPQRPRKTAGKVWKFVDSKLQTAPTHFGVDKFKEFVDLYDSGVCHVTAGPGMGKTTLLCLISRSLERLGIRVAPFFFIAERKDYGENRLSYFLNTLASDLNDILELGHNSNPRNLDIRESYTLNEIISQINNNTLVSKESPLVVVVDALDEIYPVDLDDVNPRNPLGLPSQLPEGLFVVTSSRVANNNRNDQIANEKYIHVCDLHLALDSDEFIESQRQEARRYAERECRNNPDITIYHNSSKDGKQALIGKICELAGYNFLVLRCFLNEKPYWQSRHSYQDLELALTDELSGFFRSYFERMVQHYPEDLAYGAAFCLGRFSVVNVMVFRAVLGAISEPLFEKKNT